VPLRNTVPTLGQSWGDRDRLPRSLDWEYEFAVKIVWEISYVTGLKLY